MRGAAEHVWGQHPGGRPRPLSLCAQWSLRTRWGETRTGPQGRCCPTQSIRITRSEYHQRYVNGLFVSWQPTQHTGLQARAGLVDTHHLQSLFAVPTEVHKPILVPLVRHPCGANRVPPSRLNSWLLVRWVRLLSVRNSKESTT